MSPQTSLGADDWTRAYPRSHVRPLHEHGRHQELNERFKVPFPGEQGTHRYNVAPTEEVLAIVAPKGEPEARLLRWGLVPTWAEDLKIGNKMINAKLETVTTRPAFRNVPKGSRRALQLADGYPSGSSRSSAQAPRRPARDSRFTFVSTAASRSLSPPCGRRQRSPVSGSRASCC